MFCERCEEEMRKLVYGLDRAAVNAAGGRSGGDGPALVCARCGTALVAVDSADRLLRKLEELSRFGLAVDENQLLEP